MCQRRLCHNQSLDHDVIYLRLEVANVVALVFQSLVQLRQGPFVGLLTTYITLTLIVILNEFIAVLIDCVVS